MGTSAGTEVPEAAGDGEPVTCVASTEPVRRALDLFSGTGSVSVELALHGFLVDSLDADPACEALWQCDILSWDYKSAYAPGTFEVVFASPPARNIAQRKRPLPVIWPRRMPWWCALWKLLRTSNQKNGFWRTPVVVYSPPDLLWKGYPMSMWIIASL